MPLVHKVYSAYTLGQIIAWKIDCAQTRNEWYTTIVQLCWNLNRPSKFSGIFFRIFTETSYLCTIGCFVFLVAISRTLVHRSIMELAVCKWFVVNHVSAEIFRITNQPYLGKYFKHVQKSKAFWEFRTFWCVPMRLHYYPIYTFISTLSNFTPFTI